MKLPIEILIAKVYVENLNLSLTFQFSVFLPEADIFPFKSQFPLTRA